MQEDDAADVFIEGEANPHAHETEAKGYADDVTHADSHAPLEDDADDEGVDSIACGPQRAAGEDIGRAAYLKENIDEQNPDTHCDDFCIVGEGFEDVPSCQRENHRTGDGDDHRPAEEVIAEDVGSLMPALTYKVTHKDVAALGDTHAEQLDNHNHVVAVGACCQGLVADLVDEKCDGDLRETVRDVLAHGRDADVEQVFEFMPRHGAEIG